MGERNNMKNIYDTKEVSLNFSDKASGVLLSVPFSPRGCSKSLKRLSRIRFNLVRELLALNKELRRHKPKYLVRTVLFNKNFSENL